VAVGLLLVVSRDAHCENRLSRRRGTLMIGFVCFIVGEMVGSRVAAFPAFVGEHRTGFLLNSLNDFSCHVTFTCRV
jgi:hypothetical protein